MKKFVIISVLSLSLVFIPFLSLNVQAQESNIDGDLLGGLYYTTLADEDMDENMDSGFGFYLGGKYNISPKMNIIGQFERFSISNTENDVTSKLSVSGMVVNGEYNLNDIIDLEKMNVYGRGGVGYYFGESGNDIISINLENSLGFKLGAGVDYKLDSGIKITGNANYRILETKLEGDWGELADNDINLSGFEIGAGVSYSF